MLCWDIIHDLFCPLVESYVNGAAREAGSAAEVAASRIRRQKYAGMADMSLRQLRLLVYSARLLLNDLDRRISQNSREAACRYELFIPTHLANGAAHQYCFVACQFQPLTTWIESAFSFTFSSYF